MTTVVPTDIGGKKVLGIARMRFVKTNKTNHHYEEIDLEGKPVWVLLGASYPKKTHLSDPPPQYIKLLVMED